MERPGELNGDERKAFSTDEIVPTAPRPGVSGLGKAVQPLICSPPGCTTTELLQDVRAGTEYHAHGQLGTPCWKTPLRPGNLIPTANGLSAACKRVCIAIDNGRKDLKSKLQ